MKYSTLRRIGLDTMIKAGMPAHAVFVTPHSVGLQHDDNPMRMPNFGVDMFDHALEENMTLTVDLPYLEVGWGFRPQRGPLPRHEDRLRAVQHRNATRLSSCSAYAVIRTPAH